MKNSKNWEGGGVKGRLDFFQKKHPLLRRHTSFNCVVEKGPVQNCLAIKRIIPLHPFPCTPCPFPPMWSPPLWASLARTRDPTQTLSPTSSFKYKNTKIQYKDQRLEDFKIPSQMSKNKLASSVDPIAISKIWKHYSLTDSLTHPMTGVGARRCYRI